MTEPADPAPVSMATRDEEPSGGPEATRPAPRWKPLVLLAAVFLLGGFAGAAVGRASALREITSAFRGSPSEARAHFRLEAMRRQLSLSDEQVREIETVLAEAEAERDRLLESSRPGLDTLRERTDERVRTILTTDQRARYDERESWGRHKGGRHGWGRPPR